MHKPHKYFDNPVYTVGAPWEGTGIVYLGGVYIDPADGLWKAWYVTLSPPEYPEIQFAICMIVSDDGIHWRRPELDVYRGRNGEMTNIVLDLGPAGRTAGQIYHAHAFPYEGVWVGLFQWYWEVNESWGEMALLFSRDAKDWKRPRPRTSFLPPTPGGGAGGAFDCAITDTALSPPILTSGASKPAASGDLERRLRYQHPVSTLWFYYWGGAAMHGSAHLTFGHGLGLAQLRADGFCSLRANRFPGTLTTVPTRPLEKQKHRMHAKSLLTQLIATDDGGSYNHATMAKLALDDLRDLIQNETTTDKDLGDAVRNADRWITEGQQLFPDESHLATLEVDFAALLEDNDRARSALNRAYEINKRDPHIATRIAGLHKKEGDLEAAAAALKGALESNRGNRKLNYQYAMLLRDISPEEHDLLAYHFRRRLHAWR